MAARIAELENEAEQARIRAAKFEKDKTKLQIEIRDISMELEAVCSLCYFSLYFPEAHADFRTAFRRLYLF